MVMVKTDFFKFLILESVMGSQQCREKDVVSEISRCLKYAPDRAGGGGRPEKEGKSCRKQNSLP